MSTTGSSHEIYAEDVNAEVGYLLSLIATVKSLDFFS